MQDIYKHQSDKNIDFIRDLLNIFLAIIFSLIS